jgi:hypothetical protein
VPDRHAQNCNFTIAMAAYCSRPASLTVLCAATTAHGAVKKRYLSVRVPTREVAEGLGVLPRGHIA